MLCKKCNQPFPSTITVDGKLRVLSSRRYCLTCSPFGRNNRRKLELPEANKCEVCGKMSLRNKNRRMCKSCSTRVRRLRAKIALMEHAGGKCERCGLIVTSGNINIFDFHHVKGKDFTLASRFHMAWDKVLKEASRCVLLCSNCHRAESPIDRNLIRIAFDYSGFTSNVRTKSLVEAFKDREDSSSGRAAD